MPRTIDDILRRYPGRVPVRVNTTDIELENTKYLVPQDMTAGHFTMLVRKSMKINDHEAIFMFLENSTLPPVSRTFEELYKDHASPDGMLQVTYTKENTFG